MDEDALVERLRRHRRAAPGHHRATAPVLLVDLNDETDPSRADSPSLARWLTDRLDGRVWWEEEVMLAGEGEMLPPWPAAALASLANGLERQVSCRRPAPGTRTRVPAPPGPAGGAGAGR